MKKIVVIIVVLLLSIPNVFADDYEMFVNHGSIMLIIDPDTGAIVFANNAAANFYMCTIEELKEMNISEINTLSPEEVANEMMMAKLQERNYFNFKHQLCDGSIKDVKVYSYPVNFMEKEMLFSIILDVTDEKIVEQQLLDSQDRERKNLIRVVYGSIFIIITFIIFSFIIYQSNRKLAYLSQFDPLTKVYNRSMTKLSYDKLLLKQQRLHIVMIDVNNLKFINDTFGHISGDKMIQKVARYLVNFFDGKDIVCRVSGDEFVVFSSTYLSPETIEEKITKERFLINGISFDVSVGCVVAERHTSYEDAFSKAESRMYSQKVTNKDDSLSRIKSNIMEILFSYFPDTKNKIKVITKIVKYICEKMKIPEDEMKDLLTATEYQHISMGILKDDVAIERVHPEKSYSILNALGVRYNVANTVLNCHELYDGSGYPKGLHGKNIPFSARILSIANTVYSHLDSNSTSEILDYFNDNISKKYDDGILRIILDDEFREFLKTIDT